MDATIVGQRPAPPLALPTRTGFAEFYVYSRTLTFVVRNGVEDDTIRFDGDADFELQRLSIWFNPAGNPQTEFGRILTQINFNVRDNGNGRNAFAGFLSMAEVFGDGRVPFVLPTTHFFKRASSATILYDNTDFGPDFDAGDVWLQLIGRKHYDYKP